MWSLGYILRVENKLGTYKQKMSKPSKSSSVTKFDVSPSILSKLKGNWSYNESIGITENWSKILEVAPELSEGAIPLSKKNYMKFISEQIRPAASQKSTETNPFGSYIDAVITKKDAPAVQDEGVDILTSVQTSAPSSHAAIAARLSPNDRAIFEREIAETNKILGLV